MAGPVLYHSGKFPPCDLDWPRLVPLIGPASAALARYDGLLTAVPNAHVLLSPLTTQEAVLSSRIEGTYATMTEVLEYEAGGADDGASLSPEKRADIEEVLNYRKALIEARDALETLPLFNRLIKNAHETLLSGVRGHNKARGQFRKIQNYIGSRGATPENARFVPIAPEHLEEGMGRWEKYLHEPALDVLVQLAIAHAEFESLHPFLDGNGRIGRLIIPLFLYAHKRLHSPTFYLSEYLEEHREEYCDRLLAVSRDDDWTGWCQFFLKALTEQARRNESKAQAILELYQKRKNWVRTLGRSHHTIDALDFIFNFPIFSGTAFINQPRVPDYTARRLLNLFIEKGLIQIIHPRRGQKPAIHGFSELLQITEGHGPM